MPGFTGSSGNALIIFSRKPGSWTRQSITYWC